VHTWSTVSPSWLSDWPPVTENGNLNLNGKGAEHLQVVLKANNQYHQQMFQVIIFFMGLMQCTSGNTVPAFSISSGKKVNSSKLLVLCWFLPGPLDIKNVPDQEA
jgi:hypothetical protein